MPLQVLPLHVPRQLHPSAGLPLQLAQPGAHESMWQLPFWQDSVAKYWQQACPHVPQLWGSLDRLTQVPPQLASPARSARKASAPRSAQAARSTAAAPAWTR